MHGVWKKRPKFRRLKTTQYVDYTGDKIEAEHIGLVLIFYVHGLKSDLDLIFSANLVSQLINDQDLARFFHIPERPAIA